MSFIYLDHNATTPVAPAARSAVQRFLDADFGNPSSSHRKGKEAKAAVQDARNILAVLLNAQPEELFFTGSATESNNLALLGATAAAPAGRRHLIVSAVEHPAVMEPAVALQRQGWALSVAKVDASGRLNVEALSALLRPDTALVSVMHASNELGTLQPIADIAPLVRRHGALLHVDASQSVGKVPVDVEALGVDLLTVAGHKMYAPKGIGLLYVRKGVGLSRLVHGAGQESGLRPGTENVPYIAAMGAAARYVQQRMDAQSGSVATLRDTLQEKLLAGIPGLVVNASGAPRLPNTLHVSLPRGSARELITLLENDVGISPGSACHANHPAGTAAGVMEAIGATEQQARGAMRLSLGYDTTALEIEQAAVLIAQAFERLER